MQVKYVSAVAPGSRWDVLLQAKVRAEDDADDAVQE